MKFIYSLIMILVLASCGCSKPCIPQKEIVEKTVTVREVIHDTVFETKADSSQAKFELVIDQQTGDLKPVALFSQPGRILSAPTVRIKDNILTVDCKAQADELFAQWKETYTDSVSKTVIQPPPLEIEKPLTTWQLTQIWLGRVFILVIIAVLFFLYKRYWPKSK